MKRRIGFIVLQLFTSLFGGVYSYGSFSMYIKGKFYGKWFILKELPYIFIPAALLMAVASLLILTGTIIYLRAGKAVRLNLIGLVIGLLAAFIKALTLFFTVGSLTPPAWIFSFLCFVGLMVLYKQKDN